MRVEFREKKENNNLFFMCSLIDCICRLTKNHKNIVVNILGKDMLNKIYELADVYHCEPLENTAKDFIENFKIPTGSFDCTKNVYYEIPDSYAIGKVYKRLIIETSQNENLGYIDAAYKIFQSDICNKIEDFNSALYYDNAHNIYLFYKETA